jgi:two-component system CheB/CheR fusion protein
MDIPEMPLTDKVNKDKLLKNKSKRQEAFYKTTLHQGRAVMKKKTIPTAGAVPPKEKILPDIEPPSEVYINASGEQNFPIVGIGASAGGLAAFEAFFSGMPADVDPGMAFILVQHLAPDHKSILTDLVRRYTRMEVFEVEDGMTVKANCTYIIPPNHDMAFLKGTLQLLEPSTPRGQRLPIDFFFRSLAQDQHERAICIVLSGTGSDGTLGIRAVKGEGGMVMAQNPASTEYDGMPRSAIATGLVDYELSPAEMPAQLITYVAHAFGNPPRSTAPSIPGNENALKKVFIFLRSQTGHDFSQYKPSTIQRRIKRRMAVNQIETVEGYVRFLQQGPAEVEALFRDLLIGVTNFFRDPAAFLVFEEKVIPNLFDNKSTGELIRVWVPGCSTGEEAYSIAILLQEYLEERKQNYKVQVFATDIDSLAIASARAGIYPASITADITPERLARFFTPEPDNSAHRINKGIRDMLVFSEQNVIKDPPFSRLDLISCRNLLIYMSSDLQKKIIPLFHYALNPKGFLFLGTSETPGEFLDLFTVLDRKLKIYQRKENFRSVPLGRFLNPLTIQKDVVRSIPGKIIRPGKMPLRELTEKALLQQVVPAGALVNSQGDIFYLHGRTGMYLEPASGEAGVNNIIRMAREGLKRDLVTSLHKASGTKETVHCQGLRVKTNGDFTAVDLTILPIIPGESEPPLYLVIFGQGIPRQNNEESSQTAAETDINTRIASLTKELQAKEEYLQTANEELETSNEELKSSNEEMQSVNEELQSTNEELETSKEELQSVNEELATVNMELQNKVADLSRANNDINNLLAGTGIATVFVDNQLRILRFTPTATRIINLISSDIGRPVGHIVSNLRDYDSLVTDAKAVLDTLIPKEVEVKSRTGAWYTMRILPYRTMDNVIEGVVINFIDITEMKETRESLRETNAYLNSLFDYGNIPIIVWDRQLRITRFNRAFEILTGRTAGEVRGRTIDLLFPPARMQSTMELIGKALEGEQRETVEIEILHSNGTVRTVLWNSAAIFDAEGKTPVAAIAQGQDITDRKQAEEITAFLAHSQGVNSGEGFFETLALYLAKKLGMDFVCIDLLKGDGLTAQTVAVWCDGRFEDNVTYALKDTPCGEVVGKNVCCFPASVCTYFPRDEVLVELRAESYVGATLWSHAGEPIGLIAVIGRNPLVNRELAETMLKMVAVRAAGEMERFMAEKEVQKLLAEKKLLLREVHHRIKNNMNVVTSLLSMQSDTQKDPTAALSLKDAGSRVRTMMVLYDKLYQSVDFTDISAMEYLVPLVDDIIGNFPNHAPITVEKQIDDVILDAKILSPVGMIINELLTNTMKHAFINRDNGLIRISFSLNDAHATLTVEDNGTGIPESVDLETPAGFGMQLVSLLTQQLDGTIRIERDSGTRYVLEFNI